MTTLRPDEALTHPGSLLSADAQIVAPYDFEVTGRDIESARALGVQDGIVSALAEPLRIDYTEAHAAHIINGMGVTLGDSIIGLTAIQAIAHAHPHVRFTVYRPAEAPRYVEALYALAQGVIADFRPLPWPLAALPADGPRIDVGNHLFWPAFMKLPMIDFFLEALGVDAATVPAAHKANRWLQRLRLPALPAAWQTAPYVMFCPTASTPVRSIPASAHTRLVDALARRFDLPVLGFGAVDHPRYIDVSALSPDTAHFLAWVAKRAISSRRTRRPCTSPPASTCPPLRSSPPSRRNCACATTRTAAPSRSTFRHCATSRRAAAKPTSRSSKRPCARCR